jgi:hypothetical protein
MMKKIDRAADASLTLAPTDRPGYFRSPTGQILAVPEGWLCLPPGDAGLTRRVKSLGPTWTVVEKKGRKTFSLGVWAPADQIQQAREQLAAERADPAYARRKVRDARRREQAQDAYIEDFRAAINALLRFDPTHATVQRLLADAVTAHATPVGSGTVARTQRIPLEQRAEAALIAWLRHHTTLYDSLAIARIKGERRRVRRYLAEGSRRLLEAHRTNRPHDRAGCTLCSVLLATRGADDGSRATA